jgi:hypothetical protein
MQGFQRVWRLLLLGTAGVGALVTVQAEWNYNGVAVG